MLGVLVMVFETGAAAMGGLQFLEISGLSQLFSFATSLVVDFCPNDEKSDG